MFNSREHEYINKTKNRYACMSDDILNKISPKSLKKYVKKLKDTLNNKNKIIKRLQIKDNKQKKRLCESLEILIVT